MMQNHPEDEASELEPSALAMGQGSRFVQLLYEDLRKAQARIADLEAQLETAAREIALCYEDLREREELERGRL